MAAGRPVQVALAALCALLVAGMTQAAGTEQYVGKFIGKLSELHHSVSGEVYAVDARTLYIKDFTYDGEGPAAYFYVGSSRAPSNTDGYRIRDEEGNSGVLKRYRRRSITLTLPEGKNLNNIKWFSVWCDDFAVNFGDVKIPRNFDYPKPQKIEPLRGAHDISSDPIVIVDAQTLLVPNLSYDGEAPDAKFWVGRGPKPSPQGIRVPDENGKEVPLRRYDRKTVVLTLPHDLTVFDIGHFGIWCEAFTVDFGHVRLPITPNVPPSLKMLGVSPQSKLNCEVLNDELAFEVRWAVAGDSIVLQLVSKLENGEYMSFGVSGEDGRSRMIGGDVVVAWVDKSTMKGYADDYYLEAKSQCSGPRGSCPDERIAENTNNIRLLNAAMVNGYSIVTYQRPLKASDELDRPIHTNQSQAIIWAIGPLNQRNEVSFHSNFNKKDQFIDFGRPPKWNCPLPESDNPTEASTPTKQNVEPQRVAAPEAPSRERNNERRRGNSPTSDRNSEEEDRVPSRRKPERRGANRGSERSPVVVPTPKPVSKRDPWYIPPIQCDEPDDGVFYAQLGPTGGKRGYPAITGHVGWGISWYINGLLIPEINVVRGKTYSFITEGGIDPEIPAKYHPFYITDDPIGGYEHKTPEEKRNVTIFAGARRSPDGNVYPTGVGRLCHWTHLGDKEADDFQSFGAFQRTLELRCDQGEPGVITWTPDHNTPDTVYYQCYSHRYLGWKINVLDSCDIQPAGSAPEPALALPDGQFAPEEVDGDLKSSPSIIVETRIKPNDLFQKTQTKQITEKHEIAGSADDTDPDNYKGATDAQNTQKYPTPLAIEKIALKTHQDAAVDRYDVVDLTTANQQQVVSASIVMSSQSDDPAKLASQTQHNMSSEKNVLPLNKLQPNTKNTTLRYRPMNRPATSYVPNTNPRRPTIQNHPPTFVMKTVMRRPQVKKPHYRIPARKRPIVPIPIHEKLALKSNQEPMLLKKPKENIIEPSDTTIKESNLHPAINTGFHPESVVIEGGFKPIINKEMEERIAEDTEDNTDDIGVITVKVEPTETGEKITESFEPMFIPSPPDSRLVNKKHKHRINLKKNPPVMFIVKHVARSADSQFEKSQDGDEMVMAAERVQAYYLPPDNMKTKPIEKSSKPTDIDIPPGAVVTYDGKTVSGSSLTSPLAKTGSFVPRSSKLSNIPQFGPFRGEIPPLDTKSINIAAAPQLKSQGVLNRELGVPEPTSQGRTKLTPSRQYIQPTRRTKRSAHHTPEHTAQQAMEKGQNQDHVHDDDHHDHDHHDHHDHDHHDNASKANHALMNFASNYILFSAIIIQFLAKLI